MEDGDVEVLELGRADLELRGLDELEGIAGFDLRLDLDDFEGVFFGRDERLWLIGFSGKP